MAKKSRNSTNMFLVVVIIILIAIAGVSWVWMLRSVELLKAEREANVVSSFGTLLQQHPDRVMSHHEHEGLVLTNGDVMEFSRDTSLSTDDAVMLLNVAALEPGVVDLDNVPACPHEDMENEKFCFVPSEALAEDDPHLAEMYPEGVLLRSYDLE